MPEENVDLRAEVEAEVKEENEIIQDWTDEDATEAEAMGWIPPDRSQKLPEGKKFVKPREYMERNPLYKKMKKLEQSYSNVASQFQKISENEHKKAEKEYQGIIDRLEAEKVAALDEGDNRRVVDIDKELRATEKPEVPVKDDPIFKAWVSDNEWYEKDTFLHVEADRVAERYLASGINGQALLDATHDHLKQLYPDKFGNKERNRPAAVEGTTAPAKKSTSKNLTEKDLTPDELTVFKNLMENDPSIAAPEAKADYFRQVIEVRD